MQNTYKMHFLIRRKSSSVVASGSGSNAPVTSGSEIQTLTSGKVIGACQFKVLKKLNEQYKSAFSDSVLRLLVKGKSESTYL